MNSLAEHIVICGARVHNLKNFDLKIPKNKFVVVTGPSGSGKSSLAFDLIYAESQRRFIESLSPKARQFLELMDRPDVDSITGLSPAIALSQRQARYSPHSTLASITEIQDFLQTLYAKLGSPKCSSCGEIVRKTSSQEIINELCSLPEKTKLQLLIPWKTEQKEVGEVVDELKKQGFVRARFNGEIFSLDDEIGISEIISIEIVYDRIVIKKDIRERLADSVEECLRLSGGRLSVLKSSDPVGAIHESPASGERLRNYSNHFYCSKCDLKFKDLSPRELALGTKQADLYHFAGKSFRQIMDMTLAQTYEFILGLKLDDYQKQVSSSIFSEIRKRISNLSRIGLPYLKLNHKAQELSTGESQRVRLASCLSSELSGVLYILDEPSLGLDSDNVKQLIELLKDLREKGNSILVVEHDFQIIKAADYVIEMGPGAGEYGGEIISFTETNVGASPFAKATEDKELLVPHSLGEGGRLRLKADVSKQLTFKKINYKLLKKDSLNLPLSSFIALTGPSGCGKSLLLEYLHKTITSDIDQKSSSKYRDHIDKVIFFDQSPIGTSPRSNPATYLDILPEIRSLLSSTQEARLRGYKAGRFSFNVKGGRCETCQGAGQIQIEIKFLSDIFVDCSSCHGKRFNFETLDITYKGYNIYDILELSIEDALKVFQNIPKVSHKLRKLKEVGLGYLKLGQGANTLSGGEAQRVKLAKELSRKQTGKTLYLFDEPTQGLYLDDLKRLLEIFRTLVDLGNTVLVAEHDRAVMNSADHVLDLFSEKGI